MKRKTLDYVARKVRDASEYHHAARVADYFSTDNPACAVAALHDIVEDGYATFEEVQEVFDLNATQMSALKAITRNQNEQYFDYIARVYRDDMAREVKIADLTDNMRRCVEDLPQRCGLIRRYARAYMILTDN